MEAPHVTFHREIEYWRRVMQSHANHLRGNCDNDGADFIESVMAESDKSGVVTPEQVFKYSTFLAEQAEDDD